MTRAVGKALKPPAMQSWGKDSACPAGREARARTSLSPVSKPQKETAQIGATATRGAETPRYKPARPSCLTISNSVPKVPFDLAALSLALAVCRRTCEERNRERGRKFVCSLMRRSTPGDRFGHVQTDGATRTLTVEMYGSGSRVRTTAQ